MDRERVIKMKFTHWFTDKFQRSKENPPTPTPSRNQQKSARSDKYSHKKAKMSHGGPRKNSGGKREGAGRKYKEYPSIVIDYNPDENKETLLRFTREVTKWILEDRLYYRKAATILHAVEIMAELRIPTEIEEDIIELQKQNEEIRELIAIIRSKNQWDRHKIN